MHVELHIEQGPILEDEGITIGVVEGVQGISWTELTISGRSAHAGTTPMNMAGATPGSSPRRSRCSSVNWRLASAGAQVATVGRFEVRPDLVNGRNTAILTVDLRNTDDAVLRQPKPLWPDEVVRLLLQRA